MTAPLVELLRDGHAVFGIFSGDHTAEQGAAMADNAELDFVFYSLERGPFDIPQMGQYIGGLREGSGGAPHPLVLRVPPVGDDPEATRARVDEAIEAGVAGIVFPHVRTATEAASAVAALGDRHWPANPDGDLVSMLIIEDREGVENARAIVATGGASVVFAGPGDLSRAYERDMDAVEGAIQTVLSACNEHSVPCGITAGADDIAARIEQGFRVIIVTQPEALSVGRRAAGRTQ